MTTLVELSNVTKIYQTGEVKTTALHDATFTLERNEVCAIVGSSGSGKTTLLNILGGIDRCNSGSVLVNGVDIVRLNEKALTNYRRFDVGFVFQFYNLVQNLTALENVELACEVSKNAFSPSEMLDVVGLGERLNNFPSQLSGGEQQRVAIARALAKNPRLLLCDEPTGALDDKTGIQILGILQRASRALDVTVVLVTHNRAFVDIANKVITVRNGGIESIVINKEVREARDIVL
ncbi:MAG: ABC transporter ATP-binding protein [Coriobacteriales bacterium]|jgi:putative ABC transport system ATP-binding protein|nr:ABC transporter ATP-binding protein [Coriobacteriales bacterium]